MIPELAGGGVEDDVVDAAVVVGLALEVADSGT